MGAWLVEPFSLVAIATPTLTSTVGPEKAELIINEKLIHVVNAIC